MTFVMIARDLIFGIPTTQHDTTQTRRFSDCYSRSFPTGSLTKEDEPQPPASKLRRTESTSDVIAVRTDLTPDDCTLNLGDSASFAEGLRQQHLQDAYNRQKLRDRIESIVARGPTPLLRARDAFRPSPSMAMTAVEPAPSVSSLVTVATTQILTPPVSRVPRIAEHVCDQRCDYRPITETCGLDGCEAIALRLTRELAMYTKGARESIRPKDIWMCIDSGTLHVCQPELCDALVPDLGGDWVCSKTGLVHRKFMAPDGLYNTQMLEKFAMANSGVASCHLASDPRADIEPLVERAKTTRHSIASNRSRSKVHGTTATIVTDTLRNRAIHTIGQAYGDAYEVRLATFDADRRLAELTMLCKDHRESIPTSSHMAMYYRRAFEMATVTIVLLPVLTNSRIQLSPKKRLQCTERYGMLIWRTWTLVSALPSESRPRVDGELRFRQFALGVLYHAKCGFAIDFDLAMSPEYATHRETIDSAVLRILAHECKHAKTNEGAMTRFSRRYKIVFLSPDTYLDSRLVQENKIGTKRSTIDGIQVESIAVNVGTRLVKDGLTALAEWSKRCFVRDVVERQMDPIEAVRMAEVRAADMHVRVA
jgi:hypothetical protein